MLIQRGVRDKLSNHINDGKSFDVVMEVSGNAEYDFCCFGVDGAGKLSDDRYMVFYNQTSSPSREIEYSLAGGKAKFTIKLAKLPQTIQKLVFTVSIDGPGTMGDIRAHKLIIRQGLHTPIEMSLSGNDFKKEKAIISIEIYRKDTWRFAAVASGFNGGLGDLLRAHGGEEAAQSNAPTNTPAPSDAPKKVSLEKKLQKDAPQLVSLAKPLKVELEKRNLQDTTARVALVLDISGSMYGRYSDGTVQEIVNKTLPLAVQFDDDGELDFWYYGSYPRRMDSVTMKNYKTAVPTNWSRLMDDLGCGNDEPKVMRQVIDEYRRSKLPAYVLFVTDGGVGSESQIKSLLIEASKEPIFWQFIGVGGSGYGVLERLDTMSGRYVDNANFFALDDFKSVSNSELYSRLLNEFPQWLKEIRKKRMI